MAAPMSKRNFPKTDDAGRAKAAKGMKRAFNFDEPPPPAPAQGHTKLDEDDTFASKVSKAFKKTRG